MKKIIIVFIVLITASFLISFLFNDFQINFRKVGGEFIRMVGIALLVYILLRDPFKKKEIVNAVPKNNKSAGSKTTIG